MNGFKKDYETLKEAYKRLNVYLMQISDIIAEQAKLYKYPALAGFSIFELLNNAFVDGNHFDWEFPIYIKIDNRNKIVEVFDLNLKSLLGMKPDQDAKSESEGILHDPVKGLKQIKFSLEKEAVESEGRVVGAKTKVNFAREKTKGLTIIQGGGRVDRGMASSGSFGGIDLTPANINLKTQNAGEGIKFHLDPAQLAQLQNAPGFVPVIISIQPMTDLRKFLEIASGL